MKPLTIALRETYYYAARRQILRTYHPVVRLLDFTTDRLRHLTEDQVSNVATDKELAS